MFDQRRKVWVKNINGVWSKSEVPVLTPNFAGIGTREINDAGLQAIRDVYKKIKESLPKEDGSVENDSPFYSDEELKERGFNVKFSNEQENKKTLGFKKGPC